MSPRALQLTKIYLKGYCFLDEIQICMQVCLLSWGVVRYHFLGLCKYHMINDLF